MLTVTPSIGVLSLTIKLHRQPIKLLTRSVLKIPPSEPWVATPDLGWFMWLTPGFRHLSTRASLCWEQKNYFKQSHPNCTRNVWEILLELCGHSVILKDRSFCHIKGWHWLVGLPKCLLGSPEGNPVIVWHRSFTLASTWVVEPLYRGFSLGTSANLPLLQARWAHSVFTGTIIWPLSLFPPSAWRTLWHT